jgi:hypothetical protein
MALRTGGGADGACAHPGSDTSAREVNSVSYTLYLSVVPGYHDHLA